MKTNQSHHPETAQASPALSSSLAPPAQSPSVETIGFGQLSGGEKVTLYRHTSGNGTWVDVIDYGCRIVRICVPDREGKIDDVVPGYGCIEDFESGQERFFGCVIGRYANRIKGGRFMLDGRAVQLSRNEQFGDYRGHLHGGTKGFDRVMWQGGILREKERIGVRFSRLAPDGEEGYPGNLDATVTYWWSRDNVLKIEYAATTDKPTIVNLSNHTFFNLKGSQGGYVMDHIMQVEADSYLPNTSHFVPAGPMKPVEGTPFDLRNPRRVDYAIDTPNEHFQTMRGFSVTWVLRNQNGKLARAADLWEPRGGRGVETWTTEPGLLTYTGRALSEKIVGKEGRPLEKFGGMLLETLHYPDSPNHPEYPSTILYPGQSYYSTTEFRFYAK
jgi:aldose 1-epimerase